MAGKQRIEWLDIAKGIGILLVILGHCVKISEPLCQLIFVFHMPLFFFLAGVTASQKDSLATTLHKKTKTLLVPYIGFYLLGFAVTYLWPVWRQGLTMQGMWDDIWLADPNAVHNSSIWFLVCLFFVIFVYCLIRRMPVWAQVILIAGLYLVGVWYARHRMDYSILGYNRLPLNLDVVPLGLPFYAMGVYMRRYDLGTKITSHPLIEAGVAVVGAIGLWISYHFNGYVNTHGLTVGYPENGGLGNSVWFLIGGLCGTAAIVAVSMLIARFKNEIFLDTKRVLMWYGRNSLYVLGFQSLLIRLYASAFNHYRGGALGMYNFPLSHAINSFILVGLILVPVCVLSLNAGKRLWKDGKAYIVARLSAR